MTLIGMAQLRCRRLTEAGTNRVSGEDRGAEKVRFLAEYMWENAIFAAVIVENHFV